MKIREYGTFVRVSYKDSQTGSARRKYITLRAWPDPENIKKQLSNLIPKSFSDYNFKAWAAYMKHGLLMRYVRVI